MLFLALSALLGQSLAQYIPGQGSASTISADTCASLSNGIAPKCWQQLDLTTYVKQWAANANCQNGEGFSSCFLRLNGYSALVCNVISAASCSAPIQSPSVDPRPYYVIYNIYSINQWFSSWYMALQDSAPMAVFNIEAIIGLVGPNSGATVKSGKAMNALTSGIQNTNISGSSSALGDALKIHPELGDLLYPTGNASQQNAIQVAALRSRVAGIVEDVQANLANTLAAVENNVTYFLSFASNGNFTGPPPSLNDQTKYLYYAFNTYLASACLAGNNITGVVGLGTNVKSLATNGTNLAYTLPNCKTYDNNSVCDSWYYSDSLESTFGLNDLTNPTRDFNPVLTHLLNNFTTGPLLFENAYQCYYAGKPSSSSYSSSSSSPISNGGDETLNLTITPSGINAGCISQLPIQIWNMACTDVTKPGCEFVNAGPQTGFLSQDSGTKAYRVPFSYLGPLIGQTGTKIQRT